MRADRPRVPVRISDRAAAIAPEHVHHGTLALGSKATTTSLSALKAYTQGDEKRAHGEDAKSVPFYKMAIDLDPNFVPLCISL